MREPLEYWQQAVADLVRAINGAEIDFEGVTDPAATAIHDLQRERSAIRALVQQWREKADRLHGEAESAPDEITAVPILTEALTWHMAGEQLAALCPAPPEETT